MTSTSTVHKFAQMQHAEYEAKAMQYASTSPTVKVPKIGLMICRLAALIQQAGKSIVQQGNLPATMRASVRNGYKTL